MNIHRFFIPARWIDGKKLAIPPHEIQDFNGDAGRFLHQIREVLRLSKGNIISVLDNSGWEYEVELRKISRFEVSGVVKAERISQAEPELKLVIYQGMLKGDKFELVLQKGTELGVAAFVPVLCQRSVATKGNMSTMRIERWQRIIKEAAEQSERGKLPALFPPLSFKAACQETSGTSFVAWERNSGISLRSALLDQVKTRGTGQPQVNLFIGPEGGLTADEIECTSNYGMLPVSLGRRILRAETAGIIAAAIILYEWGELG